MTKQANSGFGSIVTSTEQADSAASTLMPRIARERCDEASPILPSLAHRVVSRQRGNSVAFGAKRTLSRIYESHALVHQFTRFAGG